jgi:hypothetical protein
MRAAKRRLQSHLPWQNPDQGLAAGTMQFDKVFGLGEAISGHPALLFKGGHKGPAAGLITKDT